MRYVYTYVNKDIEDGLKGHIKYTSMDALGGRSRAMN